MNALSDRPRILAIDDDPGLRALILATLGESYEVEQHMDGMAGLDAATRTPPDLILLDITMPDLSGYELCQALRSTDATREVPVLFLSALSRPEDRVAAYEVGGDDFLGKPFDPVELTDKIELSLRRQAERRQLREEKASAFTTAMNALSASSEIGAILSFLRTSFTCTTYEELAGALIATTSAWELTVAVQLRGGSGSISRNGRGPSSPLEAGVLTTLADCGRIAALGRRLAVNYPRVTIMVTDMPTADPERCGRLRDDLAWLAEAAEARVQALDNEIGLHRKELALQRLAERSSLALRQIEGRRQVQKASAVVVMQDLVVAMERRIMNLGLPEEQETELCDTLRAGVDRVIDIFDQGLATDSHLEAISTQLAGAAQDKAPA